MRRAGKGNTQGWAGRLDARGASFPWEPVPSLPHRADAELRDRAGGDNVLRPWLVFASSALCVFSGGASGDDVV